MLNRENEKIISDWSETWQCSVNTGASQEEGSGLTGTFLQGVCMYFHNKDIFTNMLLFLYVGST